MTGHREGKFEGANGTELFFQQWLVSEPKARLLFVHGLSEHSSRYGKTAHFFNQSGYDVIHFDLRGHGKSGGQRAFADSLEELLTDIDRFILKFAQNGGPVFLVCHSFGAQLALNYAASPYEGINRLKGIL
ncbi:MAG: alpha/beta fold hydrolase, partial [Deltaproteobacteria bacterium]|nr:alpha/beta fold hydrolase [Deltaproteobacteria bacterium]